MFQSQIQVFRYNDIVEVTGPIGTTRFRNELIPVYKATKIIYSSMIPSFSFEAIIPTSNDWFNLLERFNKQLRFPDQNENNNNHWRKGYCAAKDLGEAKSLFELFLASEPTRRVKNIRDCFDNSIGIPDEIKSDHFILELVYPKNFMIPVLLLFVLPIMLFFSLAIKFGLHEISEYLGFGFFIFTFAAITGYAYIYLRCLKVIINHNGIII